MSAIRESTFPKSRISTTLLAKDITTGLPVAINSKNILNDNYLMTFSNPPNFINTFLTPQSIGPLYSVSIFNGLVFNENVVYVVSSGGIITMASTHQFFPYDYPTIRDGMKLWIIGTSDTNYNIFKTGLGQTLNGDFHAMNGRILGLMLLNEVWREFARP